ncbi:TraK family protein [Desulfobulbus elongatus]|uniref:TraK family protein n=1 Tax=Desulfobulbus elongatus TaxID=53332 RepID=UPI0012FB5891|nr:TraK family protein [Desulfobulbus elongatus]
MTRMYGKARLEFFSIKDEFVELRSKGWLIRPIYRKFLSEEKISMSYQSFWRYVDRFENPNKKDRNFDPVTLKDKKKED